jgi:hypothetical protein
MNSLSLNKKKRQMFEKVHSTTKCKLWVKIIQKNFHWSLKPQFFSWSIV